MSSVNKKIGLVAKVKGGKRLPKGMSVMDQVTEHPYLRVVDFGDDGIDRSDIKYIDAETFDQVKRYTIDSSDIYISIAGTIGRVGIVPEDLSGANLTENAAKLTDISDDVDHRYLMYYLRSPIGQGAISNRTGGTSQPKLALYRIADIDFPYRLLSIQKAIASILSAYDDLIENNRRRIELLEQSARLLYKEWFVHLRFPGHEHVEIKDGVPEGWERKILGDLAVIKGGKQYGNHEFSDSWNVPVFGGNGIQGYSQKRTHSGFLIVFGRVGANCGSIHWSYDGAWVNNNASAIVPSSCNELVLQHLLHYDFTYLRKGTAQPFIPNNILSTVKFLVPTEKLAISFCKTIRNFRRQQQSLERQTRLLAKARDILLPRLMNGEVNV